MGAVGSEESYQTLNVFKITDMDPADNDYWTHREQHDRELVAAASEQREYEAQFSAYWQHIADTKGSTCRYCGEPCEYGTSKVTHDSTGLVHRVKCADEYFLSAIQSMQREKWAERGRVLLGVAA